MPQPNEIPPPGLPGAVAAQPAAGPPPAAGPNPAAIVKRMLAHLPVAFVVMALGIAITMVLARQRKPAWGSETVILYREGINREFVGVEGGGIDMKTLPGRLKETLLARQNLERVVKDFNLYPQIYAAEGMIAAVDRLRTKITFKGRSAETFLIAFEGSTPEETQQVTARLAEILINDWTEKNRAKATKDIQYIEEQKKRADDNLDQRESDLIRFIAVHPEFAAENNAEQAGAGIRTEKAKAIADPETMALERQVQRLKAANAAQAGGGAAAAPAPGGGGAVAAPGPAAAVLAQKQAADAELAAAQKDLADKSEKLQDAHPDVRMAKARLQAAQDKSREATAALIAATPAPADPLAAPVQKPSDEDIYETKSADPRKRLEMQLAKNERELQARKRGLKTDVKTSAFANQIIDLETEWRRLNREREKAKSLQNDVDARLNKARQNAESERGGYGAQVMVLDPAYLPTTSGTMAKSKFIAIGVVVSLLVGLVGAAAFGMFFDDRVFMADELAGVAPVLAAVPRPPAPPKPPREKAARNKANAQGPPKVAAVLTPNEKESSG
ncbi:MAG: protein kinase [Polyangiaceae bacterium]|nr:protein kinase [Polyangiaceae bacterium]